MQTTSLSSEEIQRLYDGEYSPGLHDYEYLVNNIREHIDRYFFVMKYMNERQPRTVLDIGCNRGLVGGLCRWTNYKPSRLVGVDVSPLMGRVALQTHGYDRVDIVDVSKPFALGELFDLVFVMELLEHVPDPEQVIRNADEHTRVGSVIVFSTPHEGGPIDGTIHVRHYGPEGVYAQAKSILGDRYRYQSIYLPSLFCEKPQWQGWNFTFAERV